MALVQANALKLKACDHQCLWVCFPLQRTEPVSGIYMCLHLFFPQIEISSKGPSRSYILMGLCLCSRAAAYLILIKPLQSISFQLNELLCKISSICCCCRTENRPVEISLSVENGDVGA